MHGVLEHVGDIHGEASRLETDPNNSDRIAIAAFIYSRADIAIAMADMLPSRER